MRTDLDKNFWSKRYKDQEIGWDLKKVSPPLKVYIDQLQDRSIKILIPGAGNSYEAEYLYQQGFDNIQVLDIAEEPLQNFRSRIPEFPDEQVIQDDFFKFDGAFDLILEQTFFCALPPEFRLKYAEKMFSLLNQGGKLVGLLFEKEFDSPGPPFGGNKEEYLSYFRPYFEIKILEPCINSIPPRKGTELFFVFEKK